jgi:hypothetical protein
MPALSSAVSDGARRGDGRYHMGRVPLDIIALIGTLRDVWHRSVPEIHQELCTRGVLIAERTVTNLLARYARVSDLAPERPGSFT